MLYKEIDTNATKQNNVVLKNFISKTIGKINVKLYKTSYRIINFKQYSICLA